MMKTCLTIAIAATITAVPVLCGCTPVNKVKRTLALNDLQIQAGMAEDRGDYQEAYELWTNYVERRPHSVLAEYRLGLVETRLGLYEQAMSHLRVAHDLKPGEIIYIEALAEAYILADEPEQLMDLLHNTIHEGPKESGYLRLAHYAQRIGMMDEAKQALRTAIVQSQATKAAPYIALADFANTIKDTQLEIENLRYALWFDNSDPVILQRLETLGMIPGPSLALNPETDLSTSIP